MGIVIYFFILLGGGHVAVYCPLQWTSVGVEGSSHFLTTTIGSDLPTILQHKKATISMSISVLAHIIGDSQSKEVMSIFSEFKMYLVVNEE